MNKDKALEFANEFINDLDENLKDFNNNNPMNFFVNSQILKDDPNLTILNDELNKLGFKITNTKENDYQLTKI